MIATEETEDEDEAGRRDRPRVPVVVAETLDPRKADTTADAGGGNAGMKASAWGTRLPQEATAAARAAVRRAGPMTLWEACYLFIALVRVLRFSAV